MHPTAAALGVGLLLCGAASWSQEPPASRTPPQPQIGARVVEVLRVDGLLFRDLNKNGKLDPYEDWRLSAAERVDDLVSQMTIEEKAGLMVGPSLAMGPGGTVREDPVFAVNPFAGGPPAMASPGTTDAIAKRHIVQFINRENAEPRTMAAWTNAVQQVAEGRRLGTPVLFVTNPRNHYGAAATFGIAEASSAFSQWPGTLGLAATRDVSLVEEFARIAAREYVAVGIRGAYHPTADVATEPRWGRIRETFGEDASVAAEMIAAVVRGFQGRELGPTSVALTTKHFPGAGPASEGQDAHFPWGKYQVYPGRNLEYHLLPWKAAIREGTAMIMPYYAVPKGVTAEELGMAYNAGIVTGLLRGKLGYTGVVNSDTGITTGMPWGVESLSLKERYKKAIEAGVDRLGGDSTPEIIVELVKGGALPEARVDESARRILRVLFALGLFENPYVSPETAARTVRRADFQQKADLAQRKSVVLLKNAGRLLPLGKGARMYVEGVDPAVAARYGYVSTGSLEDADVAILRVSAGRGGLGPGLRAKGPVPVDLTLPSETLAHVRSVLRKKPTVVALHMDNPLVVPELASEAGALLATFGVSDEALLDVLTGRHPPTGKLPFEMPSSMDAVRAQLEDVPHDSKDPLFPIGSGLTYAQAR
ncbi:MAG TPA: glycoside hydrolase family 3 N-terminal domain-containing protein [Vicinamibacteria bacterium]|nr:glycoside hydrolase family 3 N-terminal domain-containing protein [Vicinamibacteria bacterium]